MAESIRVIQTGTTKIGQRFTSLSEDGLYIRTLIHTGFIAPNQDTANLLFRFIPNLDDFPGKDKVVCLGSKAVAVLQNRIIRENQIHPIPLCRFVSQFGTKTEHGVGIAGYPKKIQAAIDEVGLARILLALGISGLEKTAAKLRIIKKSTGLFFMVAGDRVKAIDGLTDDGGYDHHVLLCPDNQRFLKNLHGRVNFPVALVDINYVGGNVPVTTPNCPMTRKEIFSVLHDNPFGQRKERTPIAVIGKNS